MSLLRTAARVSVASSVHGKVQRRQQQRWAAEDQRAAALAATPPMAPSPPPPAAPEAAPVIRAADTAAPTGSDMDQQLAQLRQLGELRDSGILTDAEFEAKKALILGG